MVRHVAFSGTVVTDKNGCNGTRYDPARACRVVVTPGEPVKPDGATAPYRIPMLDWRPDTTATWESVSVCLGHLRVRKGVVWGISPQAFALCLGAWTFGCPSVVNTMPAKVLTLNSVKVNLFSPMFWAVYGNDLKASAPRAVPLSIIRKYGGIKAQSFVEWMCSLSRIDVLAMIAAVEHRRPMPVPPPATLRPTRDRLHVAIAAAGRPGCRNSFACMYTDPLMLLFRFEKALKTLVEQRLEQLAAFEDCVRKRAYWACATLQIKRWGRAEVTQDRRSRPNSEKLGSGARKRAKVADMAVVYYDIGSGVALAFDRAALTVLRAMHSGAFALRIVPVLVIVNATDVDAVAIGKPLEAVDQPWGGGAEDVQVHQLVLDSRLTWDDLLVIVSAGVKRLQVTVDAFAMQGYTGPVADMVTDETIAGFDPGEMLQDVQQHHHNAWAADPQRADKVSALTVSAAAANHTGQLLALQPLTVPARVPMPVVATFEVMRTYANQCSDVYF